MALILSIETSSKVCSVSLHRDGELILCREELLANSHSENLLKFFESVLTDSSIKMNELNAIAISEGPGSYTGLRIGTSTAKGLCFALDIPLIAIKTLETLVEQMKSKNEYIDNHLFCPMIDARRIEVYTAIYDSSLKLITPIEAKAIDEESFISLLESNQIVFFGNGAMKCSEVINHKNASFVDGIECSSEYMGELAFEKYQNKLLEDVAYFEPFYLKEFYTVESKKKLI